MQDMSEIYSQYSKIVYKYIFCLTKNEETAEEITQDTFLVAVKTLINLKESVKYLHGYAKLQNIYGTKN